jgi:GNAT acetyltransferase-like protein
MHEGYDDLVEESPQGSVFATSWWLDAVAEGGWRTNALEDDGEIAAAWPTVVRATRWGEVHEGAPLTPFLGPLFRPEASELKRRSNEVKRLEQLVAALGSAAHVEARCNPAFDYWTPLAWHGFTQTTHYTWRLPELGDLDEVLGNARDVRPEIRKAEKRGVEVVEGSLADFQAVHSETVEYQQIDDAGRNRLALQRIERAAGPRDARFILLARDAEGRVHAGGYFVRDSRWAYYLVGASDPSLRSSGASSLVLWKAIERAGGLGLGFDFEGSMLQGVEHFFRSFAGVPTPYSIVRSTPSRALRVARPVKRVVLALRSRRPPGPGSRYARGGRP